MKPWLQGYSQCEGEGDGAKREPIGAGWGLRHEYRLPHPLQKPGFGLNG